LDDIDCLKMLIGNDKAFLEICLIDI